MDSTAPINLLNKTLNKLKHNIHKRNKYNPAFGIFICFYSFFKLIHHAYNLNFFFDKALTNLHLS